MIVLPVGKDDLRAKMMADFSNPAPVEETKTDFLHDLSTRPAGPGMSREEHARDWLILLLGLVIGAAFVALAFETRGSWESHRDWVVPVLVPPLVIGGVAAAYLFIRNEWNAAAAGLMFGLASAGMMATNISIGRQDDPSAGTQNMLAAAGGVTLGLSVALFIFAMIWVEFRRPTRAPAPEM